MDRWSTMPVASVTADEVQGIVAQVEEAGALVVEFDTSGIRDERGFFAAVTEQLPLDPPLVGPADGRFVWDALSDSLWEGMFRLSSDDIFLVWRNWAGLMTCSPGDFETASAILQDIAVSMAQPRFTSGSPKRLRIAIAQSGQ